MEPISWATVIGLLFKPVILPVLTWVIGWLMPSPLSKSVSAQENVKKAEDAADAKVPDSTQLDKLP